MLAKYFLSIFTYLPNYENSPIYMLQLRCEVHVMYCDRADSKLAASQWETSLQPRIIPACFPRSEYVSILDIDDAPADGSSSRRRQDVQYYIDDVMDWGSYPHNWPLENEIHCSPVDS